MRALLLIPAGVVVGIVNAIAGGGGLITFPLLLGLGYSPLVANVSNAVGVTPSGYGSVWAYRHDLAIRRRAVLVRCGIATLGSIIGAVALLAGGEDTFETVVPWLIILGTLLVLVQPLLRREVGEHQRRATRGTKILGFICLPICGVYGGYFGVAQGIMFLGILGLFLHEPLHQLNADKNALAASVNTACAIVFAFSGPIVWSVALCLAAGTSIGGAVGVRVAQRLPDEVFRYLVVGIGLTAAIAVAVT